jgi:hypothetical protein
MSRKLSNHNLINNANGAAASSAGAGLPSCADVGERDRGQQAARPRRSRRDRG